MNKKGFTLLEFIIVVAIVAIAAGVALTVSPNASSTSQFDKTVKSIVSVLREQRSFAISGYQGGFVGVNFEEDKYVTYSGNFYWPGMFGSIDYALTGDFQFINIDFNSGSNVTFGPPNGEVFNSGSLQLTSPSLNKTTTIIVDSSGFVTYQ